MARRYTRAELEQLPSRELAALLGQKLRRGRPSAVLRQHLIEAAYAAKVKKAD